MSKENFQLIGSPNRALLAATLGFFFGAMSISLFGPTAKALTDVMGLTPAEVGLLVAVPSLSGSLLRIPFGASVDVNGGRKSFNFLMLCSAIGLIGLSILFSTRFPENMAGLYPVILLLGCLAGCGIGICQDTSKKLVRSLFIPEEPQQGLCPYASLPQDIFLT